MEGRAKKGKGGLLTHITVGRTSAVRGGETRVYVSQSEGKVGCNGGEKPGGIEGEEFCEQGMGGVNVWHLHEVFRE